MFDHVLVAISAVLAGTAAVANGVAAAKGNRSRRVVCAMRGLLATIYMVAYVWLFFHPTRRLEWSRLMIGVSLTAWTLVWIYPAWQTLRLTTAAVDDDDQ